MISSYNPLVELIFTDRGPRVAEALKYSRTDGLSIKEEWWKW